MTRPHVTEDDLAVAIVMFSEAVEMVSGGELDMEGLDRVAGQLFVSPAVMRSFMSIQPDDDGEPLSTLTRVYGAFLTGVAAADSAHARTRGAR